MRVGMICKMLRYGLSIIGLCALFGGWALPVHSADRGSIVGVRISPDLSRVVIESDGPLGNHKAFVIGQPYRLVLDFPEADLSPGLSRIKVEKAPIREIRLGSTPSRTRVVIDFGRNAAPPYKIHRERGHLVLALGKSFPVPHRAVPEKRKASAPKAPTKPQPKHARKPEKKKTASEIRIKSATVVDGLVVLELAGEKTPKKSCKLVLEVDLDRMKVSRAVLNDGKGNLTCEDLQNKPAEKSAKPESAAPARGPRKAADEKSDPIPTKTIYQWGMPKVESRGPTKPPEAKGRSGTSRSVHPDQG